MDDSVSCSTLYHKVGLVVAGFAQPWARPQVLSSLRGAVRLGCSVVRCPAAFLTYAVFHSGWVYQDVTHSPLGEKCRKTQPTWPRLPPSLCPPTCHLSQRPHHTFIQLQNVSPTRTCPQAQENPRKLPVRSCLQMVSFKVRVTRARSQGQHRHPGSATFRRRSPSPLRSLFALRG